MKGGCSISNLGGGSGKYVPTCSFSRETYVYADHYIFIPDVHLLEKKIRLGKVGARPLTGSPPLKLPLMQS